MATQGFIFQCEDVLINARSVVQEIKDGFRLEQKINDGEVYKENYDAWGTLKVNAIVLRNKLNELLSIMGDE